MYLVNFLFSKFFLKQILLITLFTVFLFILSSYGLKFITNHDQYLTVPDLKGVHLNDLPYIMEKENLRFEVIDSTKFDPDSSPKTVISHIPFPKSEVKKNRKIYLIVNPSSYRKITVPNLVQITKRNAESMIKSVGFELGRIIYKNNIGKDMVLEIQFEGKKIEAGILLPKTTKIDLILGNGKR